MIILKKRKLKLKKNVYFVLGGILLLILAIIIGTNVYQDIKYKQTNEYKLLELGYSAEEIDILEENLTEEEVTALTAQDKNDFLLSILQDEYFIKDNLNRYMTYHEENEGTTTRNVVATVNTNSDYARYDHNIETDTSKDYLMLVNKYYHLNEDYVPTDLVNISNRYYYGEDHQIRSVVYEAFVDMWNQANNDGIYLIINSSYRNYQDQQSVYDSYKDTYGTTYADSIAARPGYSEHQTGLSLDIFSTEHTTTTNFKDSPAYLWLTENAYKYGFIQRYKETNEDITGFAEESWHWRYVGVEVATYLHEHDITFDEYYAYFIANE